MNETLVSVIVPVYNTEKYLKRSIDSVLAQTYRNLEIILVNDGSGDDSISIIRNAAEKESRIRAVSQTNRGPSAARNTGMDAASGEYFLFCDSDDTVEPEWVRKMLGAAKAHPDSLVICGHNRVVCHSDGEYAAGKAAAPEGLYAKEEYFALMEYGIAGSAWNKIYNASLIRNLKLSFDESVRYAEDVAFNLEYMKYVSSFFVLDEALYNYFQYDRENRETLSHNATCAQLRFIYQRRLPFISNTHMADFDRMYFYQLWGRFADLETRNDIKRSDRRREMREILNDKTFCRFVEEYGAEFFEKRTFPLIKKKALTRYELLQWASKQKKASIQSLKEHRR